MRLHQCWEGWTVLVQGWIDAGRAGMMMYCKADAAALAVSISSQRDPLLHKDVHQLCRKHHSHSEFKRECSLLPAPFSVKAKKPVWHSNTIPNTHPSPTT